ncbi:MAG TPA: N-(5'-phosphoribosyl)anthranilate isomerase, partial [Rudaea sp.]|nr:N-(5'-phosphoribosyl)anthranilate isomerase [Rudaea sp.]
MNLRTRIKFCGMRRVEDALAASALGVDAVGIVLTQKSIRFVELDAAARI